MSRSILFIFFAQSIACLDCLFIIMGAQFTSTQNTNETNNSQSSPPVDDDDEEPSFAEK